MERKTIALKEQMAKIKAENHHLRQENDALGKASKMDVKESTLS